MEIKDESCSLPAPKAMAIYNDKFFEIFILSDKLLTNVASPTT